MHPITVADRASSGPSPRSHRPRTRRAHKRARNATRHGECVDVCPAGIPLVAIATLNREVLRDVVRGHRRG